MAAKFLFLSLELHWRNTILMKLFLSLVTLIFVVPSISAAESKCEARYRVGLSVEAPFYELADNGKTSGLSYELIKELEKHTGCTLNQDPLSIQKATTELSQYRLDFYAFSAEVPQWNEHANFDKVYSSSRMVVVEKKAAGKNKSVADVLKDHSIKITAAVPTVISEAEKKSLIAQGRYIEASNLEAAFKLLKDKKVQAVIGTPVLSRYHLKLLNLNNEVRVFHDTNTLMPIGIYSSKKRISASERERFKKALKEMVADGSLRKVLSKYVDASDIEQFYKF